MISDIDGFDSAMGGDHVCIFEIWNRRPFLPFYGFNFMRLIGFDAEMGLDEFVNGATVIFFTIKKKDAFVVSDNLDIHEFAGGC